MASNEQKFIYTLEAQYKGSGELGRLKGDLKSLKQVESMKQLGADVLELNRRFREARTELESQAREMKAAETVTRQMTANYRKAQSEVGRLAEQLNRKQQAYRQSREALRAAGVDTAKLAVEERRLADAARATGEVWSSRQALGLRAHRDVRDEILRLRTAYDTLRASGTLTSTELIQAKQQLNSRIAELRTTTAAWAGDLGRVQTGLLGLAGVGYAIGKAFTEFSSFEGGMAAVYTLVDVSTEKFEQFKDTVRDVAEDLPQQTGDLTKALYDIISAGVELEKSPQVLELSAKAATAGITDTQTAANVGIGALNAYGKSVDELENVYDILFTTVKYGVTTFPALAQSIGDVLPTARAANVDIINVGAAVAALTKAGIKTPQAMTSLKGAINALAAPAPEAKKQFDALGITWQGLIPTLEQIRAKSLSIDQLRTLIPDVEARTGVISLTQNFDSLEQILGEMDGSAGAMQGAYDKMAAAPSHEIDMMTKQLKGMMFEVGSLAATVILPTASSVTTLVGAINDAPAPIRMLVGTMGAAVTGAALWRLGLGSVVGGLVDLTRWVWAGRAAITGMTATNIVGWLTSLRSATLAAAAGNSIMAASLRALGPLFVALWSGQKVYEAARAYMEMKEAQQMAADAATKAEAAEARYQDRLSRASAAAGLTLSSWREVQKAYQDGLIDYNQETDAYTKGSGVRREAHRSVAAAAKDSAQEQQQVTGEALKEMERQYKEFVDEAKRLYDEIAGRQQSLVEDLRAMGRTGMSGLEAWEDLKREAEEYEAAARAAAEAGDLEQAVKMADAARDRYKQLNTEVKDGDDIMVSQQDALQTAMEGVKRSGELAIEILGKQETAAEEAAKKLDLDANGQLSKAVEDVADGIKDVADAGIDMGDTLVDQVNRFGTEAAKEFDDIERWLNSPHKMTIDIEQSEAHALGGLIGGYMRGGMFGMASGGYLAMRSMLRGGHFPGFGGGDRRHVVAEDGEYMFDKFRVRDAGLDIVRDFHAGRYAAVVAGLVRRFNLNIGDIVHRKIGGAISRLDEARTAAGPQHLAAGGSVTGGGSGEVMTFRIEFGRGRSFGPFTGPADDATAMLRTFQQALEGSS